MNTFKKVFLLAAFIPAISLGMCGCAGIDGSADSETERMAGTEGEIQETNFQKPRWASTSSVGNSGH